MRVLRGVALAIAFALTAIAAAPPAPQDEPAFAVAMLRRDGVLLPFAAYQRGKWTSPWPRPGYRFVAPLTIAAIERRWWGPVSPTTTWIAWPAGGEPRAVHVRAPVVIPAHCLSAVGLSTDYQSREAVPPPTQLHHPKDGVATTGDETIEPIEVLDETSPESVRMLDLLMPEIDKAERRVPLNRPTGLLPPKSRGRSPLVPRLEVLCRAKATSGGAASYYFEAARELPPARDAKPGCNRVLFTQGFASVGAKELGRSLIFSTLDDCNRNAIDFGLPLGSLTLNGVQYWLVQFSGRGREEYAIVETSHRNVRFVVNAMGGGC